MYAIRSYYATRLTPLGLLPAVSSAVTVIVTGSAVVMYPEVVIDEVGGVVSIRVPGEVAVVDNDAATGDAVTPDRITSYNVCYTKLLRTTNTRKKGA